MSTTWITRQQWGARPQGAVSLRPISELIGVTVHYTTGQELGQPDPAAWVRSIQRYHVDSLGYADIAYNALIDVNGRIYAGRSNAAVGAHSSSAGNWANHHTLGVAFLGNDDAFVWDVTPAANRAFVDYFRTVHLTLGHKPVVYPHSHWKATACPGDEIRGLLGIWQAAS